MSNQVHRPLIYRPSRGVRRPPGEHAARRSPEPREQGADWVELDVHLAADGGLVVHHDPRLPGRSVGADDHPVRRTTVDTVPLLDAALRCVRGHGRQHRDQDVTRRGDRPWPTWWWRCRGPSWPGTTSAVCISSFDEATLDRVRTLGPGHRHRPARCSTCTPIPMRSSVRPTPAPWRSTRGTPSSTRRWCERCAALGPRGERLDRRRPRPHRRARCAGRRRDHHQRPRAGPLVPRWRPPTRRADTAAPVRRQRICVGRPAVRWPASCHSTRRGRVPTRHGDEQRLRVVCHPRRSTAPLFGVAQVVAVDLVREVVQALDLDRVVSPGAASSSQAAVPQAAAE